MMRAIALARSGREPEARRWYGQAAAWMRDQAPDHPILKRLYAQATALLDAPK